MWNCDLVTKKVNFHNLLLAFSISTSSSLGDARRAKTDPPSTSQLVPTTQSFSTPAQPTFGTTQPFSTMSKSNDVTTRPSLGMTKPAFGAQALNSAAQLSFGSQPAFATAARSSESQPTTTHIRTSSQPSSFVKLPPSELISVCSRSIFFSIFQNLVTV